MKRITILLLGLFFTFTSLANPFSVFQNKIKQQRAGIKKHIKHAKIDNYTDFSGTWLSRCGDDEPLVIENEDDVISINGQTLLISGVNVLGGSNAHFSENQNIFLQWSDNGSSLSFNTLGYDVELSDEITADESAFLTSMSNGKLSRKENKLYMTLTFQFYENGQAIYSDAFSCDYDKQ